MVAALQAEAEKAEARSLPDIADAKSAAAHFVPLPSNLTSELDAGASDSLKQMQASQEQKQQQWLEQGELSRYAIKGSEEDWDAALGKTSSKPNATPPKSVNVKVGEQKAKEGKRSSQKKKRAR